MPPACSSGRARGSSSPSAWRTSRRSSAPGSASSLAGLGVLGAAAAAAPPAAHRLRARGADRRAPVRHHLRAHLLGRAVRDVRADRGAVRRAAALRRAARRRVFLPAEPLRPRLLAGVGDRARRARRSRSARACDLGTGEHAALAAAAVVLSPLASAIGNVAIKKRGAKLDPLVMNGWAMLGGGVAAARGLGADRGLGRDDVVARPRSARSSTWPCSAPASRS